MYEDTIKSANKIISNQALFKIFDSMYQKLNELKNISLKEDEANKQLENNEKNWTFKEEGSEIKGYIDFYDDTDIRVDNYEEFINLFNTRLEEIKNFDFNFRIAYSTKEKNKTSEYKVQTIWISASERKIDIFFSLSSQDKFLYDIYDLIKNTILNSPERYDYIIKKRKLIRTLICFGIGFIPTIIFMTLLLVFPFTRNIFLESRVLYPIVCIIFSYFIGDLLCRFNIDKLYKNIIPDSKYIGYDEGSYKSIYVDDVKEYVKKAEVLIGKNANNLKNRDKIRDIYCKNKKVLPFEILLMTIISIIIFLIKLI